MKRTKDSSRHNKCFFFHYSLRKFASQYTTLHNQMYLFIKKIFSYIHKVTMNVKKKSLIQKRIIKMYYFI